MKIKKIFKRNRDSTKTKVCAPKKCVWDPDNRGVKWWLLRDLQRTKNDDSERLDCQIIAALGP
jgi:hypothetical protein